MIAVAHNRPLHSNARMGLAPRQKFRRGGLGSGDEARHSRNSQQSHGFDRPDDTAQLPAPLISPGLLCPCTSCSVPFALGAKEDKYSISAGTCGGKIAKIKC